MAYVYPAGGRVGTTFQVVVGGQALGAISNAFFTGLGLEATVLELNRPMNGKEFNAARERFKELQDKWQSSRGILPGTNSWTPGDTTEWAELRAKLLKNPPNRTGSPALSATALIRVTVGTNSLPGEQELRLAGPGGLSNPLKFLVGTLPEVTMPTVQVSDPELDRFLSRLRGQPPPAKAPKCEVRIQVPTVVNGQLRPGGVDRFRFSAKAAQQLVIVARARQLIPYLADAVPGWLEAVLTIYDSQGKELITEERFRFRPDPVIHFGAPRDGDYVLEIHDSLFRGREDFVYRLSVSEEAFVTAAFPLGGKVREDTRVALAGWNLSDKSILFQATNCESGLVSLAGDFINHVPFAIDDLPECQVESSKNATNEPQAVCLPTIVNGRIGAPGQRAAFKFRGSSGQQIVAEVFARRLDSPLDSFLRLTDCDGHQLAYNDDFEDKGSGLNTHHADSYLRSTLPSDDTYILYLGDAQGHGGPEFGYRLRISAPRPDFELRIVPSSLTLRPGSSAPLTAFVLRRDGFTNGLNLVLESGADGFSLKGANIPAGQDKVQFSLGTSLKPMDQPVSISIAGQAFVHDKEVRHRAVPCEDMMQAFAYRHLVPSKELSVLVNARQRPPPRPLSTN